MTGWPTPIENDLLGSTHCYGRKVEGQPRPIFLKLPGAANLTTWPSPGAKDGSKSVRSREGAEKEAERRGWNNDLHTAALSAWKTPNVPRAHDSDNTAGRGYASKKQQDLPDQVVLVVGGETLSGSPAGTRSTGQLNPAHSRWLMGYPRAWDACAATVTRSSRRSGRRSSAPTTAAE